MVLFLAAKKHVPNWVFPKIGVPVPLNYHILIGFSIILTIHFGGKTPLIFGSTPNWVHIFATKRVADGDRGSQPPPSFASVSGREGGGVDPIYTNDQ